MTESPDPFPFTPVPTASARHDGWTPDRQRKFIVELGRLGLVAAAARAVGMSPKSAYLLRRRPGAESFAHAWTIAVASGREAGVNLAIDRAIHGTSEPIFYRGRQVGERRRYDGRLLIAALKLTARERYGPR